MDRLILFLVFFLVVLSAFGLMQWRLYRLFRRWVRRAVKSEHRRRWKRGTIAALAVSNAVFLSRFVIGEAGIYDHPLVQTLLIYPGGIFFGIIILAFILVSLKDILHGMLWCIRLPARFFRRRLREGKRVREQETAGHIDESRRIFLKKAGLSAAGVVGGIPILSSIATARDYQINRITLTYRDLSPGLEGFTIAQVSDLHSGVYMTESDMREIFEITNGIGANMITMTGDFIDNADAQIKPLYNAAGMLKAEYGIYGCLGNHDHFGTASKVTAALEQRGIVMLDNANRLLMIDGDPLAVLGIDDAGGGQRNFARFGDAMAGSDPDAFKVLLTHRPHVFDYVKGKNIDLTLAGHTHGGQVGIEFLGINLNPVYLVHKYARGLFSEGEKYLYVNVGVGMVGVPIRLVLPEISVFTLSRGT